MSLFRSVCRGQDAVEILLSVRNFLKRPLYSCFCCSDSPEKQNNQGIHKTLKRDERKFEITKDMFWKDGVPFGVIGGDLHYFRVHIEQREYLQKISNSRRKLKFEN